VSEEQDLNSQTRNETVKKLHVDEVNLANALRDRDIGAASKAMRKLQDDYEFSYKQAPDSALEPYDAQHISDFRLNRISPTSLGFPLLASYEDEPPREKSIFEMPLTVAHPYPLGMRFNLDLINAMKNLHSLNDVCKYIVDQKGGGATESKNVVQAVASSMAADLIHSAGSSDGRERIESTFRTVFSKFGEGATTLLVAEVNEVLREAGKKTQLIPEFHTPGCDSDPGKRDPAALTIKEIEHPY
jgi:hypothetical protein